VMAAHQQTASDRAFVCVIDNNCVQDQTCQALEDRRAVAT
jgi:hypothetical protein